MQVFFAGTEDSSLPTTFLADDMALALQSSRVAQGRKKPGHRCPGFWCWPQ
jgi:hypothetical protein